MPIENKIAISGTGRIGRLVCIASTASMFSRTKNEKLDLDILKVITRPDYKKLVKEYKKVQKRYYPEKDILIKNKKGEL